MGDLDSFFAKKDKKKVKGRKYDNPDDIAKRLKESEKKLEKELTRIEPPKKPLDELSATAVTIAAPTEEKKLQQEEEEWKEFTDDSQNDLTDLKISKLQIENEDDYAGGCGSGEDGEEGGGGSNRTEGVWNKHVERSETPPIVEEQTVPPKEESKTLGSGSYVPPHLRNVSAAPQTKSSRKPKVAPDITNAVAFPSLADAQTTNPSSSPWGSPWGKKKISEEKGFESVKHGSAKTFTEDYAPPKLSTANRFDALSDTS